jgi:hypothetical protein
MVNMLDSKAVLDLARVVEESTRSTREGVKYFIEPAPGTLTRAKNKRHHIIFGRRGSGKSSLLAKVTSDLTVNRSPIAYVDLEEFKGHSYPDVLLSVLIKTFNEFKKWLETAAINPASKKSFWTRFSFGSKPEKGAFNRSKTKELTDELTSIIKELNQALFTSEEVKVQSSMRREITDELKAGLSSQVGVSGAKIEGQLETSAKNIAGRGETQEYVSKKIELLHRNIMRYKSLFARMSELANGPTFLLLDDLYHLRLGDQARGARRQIQRWPTPLAWLDLSRRSRRF